MQTINNDPSACSDNAASGSHRKLTPIHPFLVISLCYLNSVGTGLLPASGGQVERCYCYVGHLKPYKLAFLNIALLAHLLDI